MCCKISEIWSVTCSKNWLFHQFHIMDLFIDLYSKSCYGIYSRVLKSPWSKIRGDYSSEHLMKGEKQRERKCIKRRKKNCLVRCMIDWVIAGWGWGCGADLGLEGSLQRAEGSWVWEQRGHAWHGGGVGGEELGREEEDGRHRKTQNQKNRNKKKNQTERYVQDSSICTHTHK